MNPLETTVSNTIIRGFPVRPNTGGLSIGKEFLVKKQDSEDTPDLEWVRYREIMKDEGQFSFTFHRVSHNDEAGNDGSGEVVTLINLDDSQAISVWVSAYPDAQFEVKVTDGERLVNALIRAYSDALPEGKVTADDVAVIASNDGGGKLTVEKVKMENGFDAWRWSVTRA
jgi:hypothetical protein